MSARSQLFHELQSEMQCVVPDQRRSRVQVFVLFVTGMVLARSVNLLAVAQQIGARCMLPSTERRLRRFLANQAVTVSSFWNPVLAVLVRRLGPGPVWFVFDPTSHRGTETLLVLSVVVHRRTLPLAWRVVPQQTHWERGMVSLLGEMVAEVAPLLPPDIEVTVLLDRGLISAQIFDLFRAAGWHVVHRLHSAPSETTQVVIAGQTVRLTSLVTRRGQHDVYPVRIWQTAGWRPGWITLFWRYDQTEPWILFSDLPGGMDRVRDYRKRMRTEATYQDWKGRGFQLDRSRVRGRDRLDRLMVVLAVATWWSIGLGRTVIRSGLRKQYDRSDRRDRSLLALAWDHIITCCQQDRQIPTPFSCTPNGVRFRWKL